MPDRVEWPTVAVACGVYGPIAAAIALVGADIAAWWAVSPLLAWCVAWQASLQHEVIHGHPTPLGWVNRLIAGPPLLLLVPFDRYRDSHLAHHIDERLTDPLDDPESWYVTAAQWRRASVGERALRLAMNRFLGRVVLGPLWVLIQSVRIDAGDLLGGRRLPALGLHAAQLALLSIGLEAAGMPLWGYFLTVVWPAMGLLLVRTFAEHRPDPLPSARTVIVESGGAFALLFLSNNLHALHHERPGLPWFLLRRVFEDGRESILDRNGGYRFRSYAQLAACYLLTPRDHPVHPNER